MNAQAPQRPGRLSSLLKNLFFLLLILQFAPLILENFRKQLKRIVYPKTPVGCLRIRGPIYNSNFYVKQINKFLKDPDIKGLLLRVDSPGGVPGSCQAIFSELKKFKKKKPIISLVENVCASGSYYLALASNDIISQPSSLIGSIGVFMRLPYVKNLVEDWKMQVRFIQSGKYKTTGSPFKELTPEERSYLQEQTDRTHRQFLKDVEKERKFKQEQLKDVEDGRVFVGTEAVNKGLIDGIGSLSDARELMKKRIVEYGMEVEKEIRLIYPKSPSQLATLLGGEEPETDPNGYSTTLSNILSDAFTKFWYTQSSPSTHL